MMDNYRKMFLWNLEVVTSVFPRNFCLSVICSRPYFYVKQQETFNRQFDGIVTCEILSDSNLLTNINRNDFPPFTISVCVCVCLISVYVVCVSLACV